MDSAVRLLLCMLGIAALVLSVGACQGDPPSVRIDRGQVGTSQALSAEGLEAGTFERV